MIERLGDGRLRVTSPALPGWVIVGRGAALAVRLLDEGFRELAQAQYAASRGESYDLSALASPGTRIDPPRSRANDPSDWTPLPDGTWRSPRGLMYPPMAQVVQRVIAARSAAGLPTRHPDAPDDVSDQWERVRSATTGKHMWRRRKASG